MNKTKQKAVHAAIAKQTGRRRAVLNAVTARAAATKRRKLEAIQATAQFAISKKVAKGPPRFKCRAYSGGPLRVGNYALPVVVDLNGLTEDGQGVFVNLDHENEARVGHVDRIVNTGRRLILSGVVSGASEAAREFLESFRAEYPWHVSVELKPTEPPEMIPVGTVVTVNGQQFEGPVYVARASRLYGLAFVPRGADSETQIELAARAVT